MCSKELNSRKSVKRKLYSLWNEGEEPVIAFVTRIDNHIYPYCANFRRYKFGKKI